MGSTTAAVTEASETYRVSRKITIQIARPMRPPIDVKAKSAPAEVATPFPPLNLSQRGYECPTTQEIAAAIPNISGEFHSGGGPVAISIEIFTAPKPFKKSSANTG